MNFHVSARALLLAVAACSGGSNPTGTTSNPPPPPPPPPAGGSTNANVSIVDFQFVPATLSVTVGTTVQWSNNGNTTHNVIADGGGFTSSGDLSGKTSYKFTFTTPGSYPYHCSYHAATYNMKGTISVTQ